MIPDNYAIFLRVGGQYVHPSILKFKAPWHEFLYWMAATPYPGADSSKENPVILASLDGINWKIKASGRWCFIRCPESSLERWNFDYNMRLTFGCYRDQGVAFLGHPNAEDVAWLDHHRNNGSIQARNLLDS